MSVRSSAIMCFLLLAVQATLVGAEPPLRIPIDGPPTEAVLDGWPEIERRREFHRTVFGEAYRQHGLRDPRWDAKALEYLELCARDYGERPTSLSRRDDRITAGETLFAAGCSDPLVCLLVGNDRHGEHEREAYARVYPGMAARYSGYARFLAAGTLVFTPGRLAEAQRQALLPSETAARMEWLADPAVARSTWCITERFWPPDLVRGDARTIDAYWAALTQVPAAALGVDQGLVALVNGIAHLHRSRGYVLDPPPGVHGKALAAALGVDREHLAQAIRCLHEAQRLRPQDWQPPHWLLHAAIVDPAAGDAGTLFGAALSRKPDGRTTWAMRAWLQVHRSRDLQAWREAALACTRSGHVHGPAAEDLVDLPLGYLADHPQDTRALLGDPAYLAAVDGLHRRRLGKGDMHGSQHDAWCARYVAVLWMMGQSLQASEALEGIPDQALARALKHPALAMTPAQFRAAVAADAVVIAMREAQALVAAGKREDAVARLRAAAASGQPAVREALAIELAGIGQHDEALMIAEALVAEQRFGAHALAATILLRGSPAQRDAALARIAAHPDQLGDHLLALTWQVRTHALHDRLLAVLAAVAEPDDGVRWCQAICLLEAGRVRESAAIFADLLEHDRLAPAYRGMCAAYLVVAARLGDRPELLPAEERLSALAEGEHGHPLMASVLRVLLGRQGRAEAIAQAASTPDPDEIHLWLALIALAAGDRAQALADLDRVDAHPTWVEAGASRRLRQWLHSDPALPGSRGKAVSDF